MKIVWVNFNTAQIQSEGDSDKLLLSVIIKMTEELGVVTEMADGRIKGAQRLMHEATTALAEHQSRKSLVSRIFWWRKGD